MSCWRVSRNRTGRPVSVRTERGDRGEPVGLHLLAAEPAAHPQALHRHPVARHAEHVGGDLLGLGRVLGAGLHEHLAVLVDHRQRAVGLEVEVLLAGEVDLALEHVARPGQGRRGVAALQHRLHALVAHRLDRLDHRHDRGQRLVVDLDLQGASSGGLERLAEHPADGVAVVHDLVGEQRLVVLDPGVVDAGYVCFGEHPHDAGHVVRRARVETGDARVGVGRLHRVGVQHVLAAADQVVGVERVAGDVQRRALVLHRHADDGVVGAVAQLAHDAAPRRGRGRRASACHETR